MLEARDGEPGDYLELADAVEQRSPAATEDLHELWRRIAFGTLISNTDDHLRNHGFLHTGGDAWTLSPVSTPTRRRATGTGRLPSTVTPGSDRTRSWPWPACSG